MGLTWALIVGDIIGATVGAVVNKGSSMGIIANTIAGLVGSAIEQTSLGTWGLTIAEMAITPSLIGAIILVLVISLFTRKL